MKKLQKDTMDMVMTGATMGIGAKVVTGAGGDASGISAMSSQMGTVGMIAGSGAVMRGAQSMLPKDMRKKKYQL